jgi:hypothetical protein
MQGMSAECSVHVSFPRAPSPIVLLQCFPHPSHDGAGHTHEHLEHAGHFHEREPPLHNARDLKERAFTVGIGGPVGSGKTALMLELCKV